MLTFVLCATGAARAIDFPLRWRFSNPGPHGGNIVDMAYQTGNPGVWIQVAEQGQIYTSSDLDLWILRASGTSNALRAVTFFGQRVVVTGESGTVLYADSLDHFHLGTLLDGATEDWLEAVTASATQVVAVGDNGAVYTSANGISWRRQTTSYTYWLTGVKYGAGVFVAVGELGFIATSPNGSNWTVRSSGTTSDLNRVAYLGTGRFLAVGQDGVALTSLDAGATWAPEVTGATNDLYNASISGTARLAVGTSEVRLHEGLGWSNQLAKAQAPPDWTYYANVGEPNFLCIAGRTGMMAEGIKTNGLPFEWRPSFNSSRHWLWDVTYASNLYVTVGDRATVMTSGDGVNWMLELVPPALTNSVFLGVGGTTNLLVAVGDQGSIMISPNQITNITVTNVVGSSLIATSAPGSTLGVIWYALPRLGTNDFQGVAWFNGLYVVTGTKGRIFTSPDGTNWTRRPTSTTNFLSGVAASPSGLVAVGDDGVILTSSDGINWTNRTSNTTNWLYRVRYAGDRFVAVGQNGTILTSANGLNWTARTSGTTEWLTDVTKITNTFFAVGLSGTVLISTNVGTWTPIGTITKKGLYGLATDSRQLITVGVEGVILRSSVLPDLTPINILRYSRFPLGTNTVQNLFLFVGQPDQQFTLDYRSDLTTNCWITGPELEFYGRDGTLYYLETLPAWSAPPLEFYRGTVLP